MSTEYFSVGHQNCLSKKKLEAISDLYLIRILQQGYCMSTFVHSKTRQKRTVLHTFRCTEKLEGLKGKLNSIFQMLVCEHSVTKRM